MAGANHCRQVVIEDFFLRQVPVRRITAQGADHDVDVTATQPCHEVVVRTFDRRYVQVGMFIEHTVDRPRHDDGSDKWQRTDCQVARINALKPGEFVAGMTQVAARELDVICQSLAECGWNDRIRRSFEQHRLQRVLKLAQ